MLTGAASVIVLVAQGQGERPDRVREVQITQQSALSRDFISACALPDSEVYLLAADSLVRFDLNHDAWSAVRIPGVGKAVACETRRVVVVGAVGMLLEYDPIGRTASVASLGDADLEEVTVSRDGRLYAGSSDGAVFTQENTGWRTLRAATTGPKLSAMYADAHGMVWFGSSRGEILLLANDGSIVRELDLFGRPSYPVLSLEAFDGNRVLAASAIRIIRIDESGQAELLWKAEDIVSSLFVADDQIYYGAGNTVAVLSAGAQRRAS